MIESTIIYQLACYWDGQTLYSINYAFIGRAVDFNSSAFLFIVKESGFMNILDKNINENDEELVKKW